MCIKDTHITVLQGIAVIRKELMDSDMSIGDMQTLMKAVAQPNFPQLVARRLNYIKYKEDFKRMHSSSDSKAVKSFAEAHGINATDAFTAAWLSSSSNEFALKMSDLMEV